VAVPGHRCGHPAELASLGVTTDAEHTVLYRVIEEQVDHANDGGIDGGESPQCSLSALGRRHDASRIAP